MGCFAIDDEREEASPVSATLLHLPPPKGAFLPVAKSFRCTIVTPSAAILDDEVTYVSFPAWDGQMGMMPGRSPLLTRLGVGTLRLDFVEGGSRWFLVDSGFAQVQGGNLTLLTERAMPSEQVSMQSAEAELAEANARASAGGRDMQKIEHAQQLALAKKSIAASSKQRGSAI